jgi:hypothetical protein
MRRNSLSLFHNFQSLLNQNEKKFDDENLPNFIKKESTQERARKRNKGQGPKSSQANSPKEEGHPKEREPLQIEPFTSSMKHIS